jgi:hypothetical protein
MRYMMMVGIGMLGKILIGMGQSSRCWTGYVSEKKKII